ncbi:hypothetical protein OSTOST_12563, partial [Ostertagia ostertagi]
MSSAEARLGRYFITPLSCGVVASHEVNLGEAPADSHSHNEAYHSHKAHQQIGYPLVFGFIFMLLVDQISNAAWSRNDRTGRNRMGVSATIGLVVHAA